MTEAVLDASVVIKWFRSDGERSVGAAHALLAAFRDGNLAVTVPSLLFLELLNVAGRRWNWQREALIDLANALRDLEFRQLEPDLVGVAAWTARGLSAYDAAYVALAEGEGIPLITDDERMLAIAEPLAVALSAAVPG